MCGDSSYVIPVAVVRARLLCRLRAEGLIAADREEIVEARLRRYYKLTGAGAERLAAEVVSRRAATTVAALRLGLAGGGA